MDLGLADRVYVVTGASRGLGRATAEVLVAEGARVVLSSRVAGVGRRGGRALGDGAVGVAPTTPTRPRPDASWPPPGSGGAASTAP